jgi:hypothetical protein
MEILLVLVAYLVILGLLVAFFLKIPRVFMRDASTNLLEPVLGLLVLGGIMALAGVGIGHPIPTLIGLVALGELLFLQGWVACERKTGMSSRRRSFFMGLTYLIIGGNVIWGHHWYQQGYWRATNIRAYLARGMSDIRSLAVSLETYYVDHKFYPPAVDGKGNIVAFQPDGSTVSSGYVPWLLTTPVAYMNSLPLDAFDLKTAAGGKTARAQVLYRYATNGLSCWIMTSNGPDRDPDIKIEEYPDPAKGNCSWKTFMSQFGVGKAIEFDASNGTFSSGDILRVGP